MANSPVSPMEEDLGKYASPSILNYIHWNLGYCIKRNCLMFIEYFYFFNFPKGHGFVGND